MKRLKWTHILVLGFGFWFLIVPLFVLIAVRVTEAIPVWYVVSWYVSMFIAWPLIGLIISKYER